MKTNREKIILLGADFAKKVVDDFIEDPSKTGNFYAGLQQALDKNTTLSFCKMWIKDLMKTDKDLQHWINGPLANGLTFKDLNKDLISFTSGVETGFLVNWVHKVQQIKASVDGALKNAKH